MLKFTPPEYSNKYYVINHVQSLNQMNEWYKFKGKPFLRSQVFYIVYAGTFIYLC